MKEDRESIINAINYALARASVSQLRQIERFVKVLIGLKK